MVCTFGDKTDVKWQKRHDLPVIKILDEDGRMSEEAGRCSGMTVQECRSAMIKDLKNNDLVDRVEKLTQSIGTCWRCHTPVEIISRDQWFMKTRDMLPAKVRLDRICWRGICHGYLDGFFYYLCRSRWMA